MGLIDSTKERKRLLQYQDQKINWKLWGPYLSERQWGTVREDYSADGDAWNNFSRESARFRAYRWGEDGIAGISDDHQKLCFSLALWNHADDYLKERLFGLTNGEGNNGEDVKEYYYYLDNTPTHSYMKYLYKYPQGKFPYEDLLAENRRRKETGQLWPEYELEHTGIFQQQKYFDVLVEYAKGGTDELPGTDDILVNITITNRGAETKSLVVLPTLWFRNVWSWGEPDIVKPQLQLGEPGAGFLSIKGNEFALKDRWLYCEGAEEIAFTENDTNKKALGWGENASPFCKDGIDRYVRGDHSTVNPAATGTKAAAIYHLDLAGGAQKTIRLRLTNARMPAPFGDPFSSTLAARTKEADEFYDAVCAAPHGEDLYNIQRQAYAGMLWNKQLYYYIVRDWLDGDPCGPPPPSARQGGRNSGWSHLYSKDILSMPDKWEYPWFASWDLAFHTTTLAAVDPDFAKSQLLFLVMEWSMHPNGMLPAYEWDFGNVNPPVLVWAAWNVYQIEKNRYGRGDIEFLRRIFGKLNMNFTWWVNKVDRFGNNIFEGGFLGLDNIRIVDESPAGETLEQSDGTAWMAMSCLYMLTIGAELVNQGDLCYRDSLRKYFQHFLYISAAMNNIGGIGLWDGQENFYFDVVRYDDGRTEPLKVYSLVGLLPLLAIAKIDVQVIDSDSFLDLERTFYWFIKNREDLTAHQNINFYPSDAEKTIVDNRFNLTLSIVSQQRVKEILQRMLDSHQFLSSFGIRSLSKYHEGNPYWFNGREIRYEPAESTEKIKGGNSNWRGPIWCPINCLIIDALRKFHQYMNGEIKIMHAPLGSSGKTEMTLDLVADDLSRRLISIFQRSAGKRPVFGGVDFFDKDPHDPVLFYEYFHGDNGAGIGASHQTGWTGLVANLIADLKRNTG
jgi:hypothetical protein